MLVPFGRGDCSNGYPETTTMKVRRLSTFLLKAAATLPTYRWRRPAVVAGNVAAQAEVRETLAAAGVPHVLADNVVPEIGVFAPDSARAKLAMLTPPLTLLVLIGAQTYMPAPRMLDADSVPVRHAERSSGRRSGMKSTSARWTCRRST